MADNKKNGVDNKCSHIMKKLESYYRDVREFKNFFIKNCSVDKKYEAYKVWAHWLIRNLCDVNDNYHIIPGPNVEKDTDILLHLKEKGSDQHKIKEFYAQVVTKIKTLHQEYHQFKVDCFTNEEYVNAISQTIEYVPTNGQGNLYHIFKFMDTYIKHNDAKYKKLVSLYNGLPEHMNYYLFEVGFNYYILDGHSLQWCVPPKVFDTLKTRLDVKTELFGAPASTHLPLYCSLFTIDKKFGALDNMFNLDPNQILEGTFEVNPPFIEKIFIRSTTMVINFLEKSQKCGKDLLFVYIMPSWLDSKGYQLLTQSSFIIDELILDENKHFYYQSSNDRMVLANFESRILVVGTQHAKQRWTHKVKNEIIKNFSYYEKYDKKGHNILVQDKK